MVKVDKFIFELSDKKVELTEDECLQLRDKLNKLFGQPPVVYPCHPQVVPVVDNYKPMKIWYSDGTEVT